MSDTTDAAWPAELAGGRILFVRLDNLGDVLMSTPAMQAVRDALPDAHLVLLASPAGQAALPHLPMLDEAMVYDAPWVKGGQDGDAGLAADHALLARLHAARFDAAIIFTVATQSALPAALMCRLAGIPRRLAVSRENPYDLLTHWVAERDLVAPGMRHEVRRQLDLVAGVGFGAADAPLVFRLREADRSAARARLAAAGLAAGTPYVLFHPGASAPSRRYPPRAYGEAAALLARAGRRCVFAGGPGEAGDIAEARAAMQAACGDAGLVLPGAGDAGLVLPGAGDAGLSLGELGALIESADVLVANNSAPAHLAAAIGTPVVDLYALTNPQHTPWTTRAVVLSHDVPCRNCLRSTCPLGHHDCLRRVAPEAVAQAALGLLAPPPPNLPRSDRPAPRATLYEALTP